MSNTIPTSLALTTISGQVAASPLNSDYSAVQTGVNGLITALSGGAAGQKLDAVDATHVQWAYPPGYEYAYTEFTANVTANNVAEAAATQIVSAGALTFDGATSVIVEFFAPALAPGGALTGGINLWDGATDLGRLFDAVTVQLTADTPCGVLRRKITPSAASHTYTVRVWTTTAANFNVLAGAGGVGVKLPGYIRITKA